MSSCLPGMFISQSWAFVLVVKIASDWKLNWSANEATGNSWFKSRLRRPMGDGNAGERPGC